MSGMGRVTEFLTAVVSKDLTKYVCELYVWTFVWLVVSLILMIFLIIAILKNKDLTRDVKKIQKNVQDAEQTTFWKINKSIDKKICDALSKNSSFNIGEYCVQQEIERVIEKKTGYYLVNDVVLYNYGDGYSTQIDHVLITPYGVFALETKYWKGDTYILDINPNNIFDSSATYNNRLIINMKDGEANLYRPNVESNVINQTIEHAVRLKKQLFGNTDNFVKGILVFVENDFCKVKFRDCINKDENVAIMSLNSLIYLIEKDLICNVCNDLMKCKNCQEIHKEVLKYRKTI